VCCSAGRYAPVGSITCNICPFGKSSFAGASICCSSGYKPSAPGSDICIPCQKNQQESCWYSALASYHPYSNNEYLLINNNVPGASAYIVYFDPLTSLESNYDYLFISNQTYTYSNSGKIWPTQLQLASTNGVQILFYSDSSTTSWGYAITITPICDVGWFLPTGSSECALCDPSNKYPGHTACGKEQSMNHSTMITTSISSL
jgi:hypothetical protein